MFNLSSETSEDIVQDVTSEPIKYPLSCFYKHNKEAVEYI